MISSIGHRKRKPLWFPLLIGLSLFAAVLSGQPQIARIDSVFCWDANDSLYVSIPYLSMGVKDTESESLYLPLERQVAKNDFVFLKFGAQDLHFEILCFNLPDSVRRDLDYRVMHYYVANGIMYVEADRSYEFDLKSRSLIRYTSAQIPELLFKSLDYEIRGLYRKFHPLDYPVYSLISIKSAENDNVKCIYPPEHDIELTRFLPCNLLKANRSYIIRASVSRPVVYLYSHDLELLDSLTFLPSQEWKDAEGIFSEKERRKMKRKKYSVFDFYMDAFERGIYKAQNIQFTDSNRFCLAHSSAFPKYGFATFMVDERKKIELLECRPDAIPRDSLWTLNTSAPQNIYANGIFCGGRFYLWQSGECHADELQDQANKANPASSCSFQSQGIRLLQCTVPY
ncbi:MAG: hypothetical protein ACK500_12000 [Flavobacteriales bacterium]